LQGQTTADERLSGDSERGYNCNLELVGQFQGEGVFSQNGPAYLGDCAYLSTENNPKQQHPGVIALDVSDPRHPRPTAYLADSAAALNPHETLQVNDRRKLLAVAEQNGPNFAVYDLSIDCRHPVLKSSITLTGSHAHMGNFAPDGLTYYVGQVNRGIGGIMAVVDVADPSKAKHMLNWKFPGDGRPHGLSLNEAGTRLYAGQPGNFGNTGSSIGPNGVVILDVSEIQARRTNPQIEIVSKLFWDDGGQMEQTLPITYNGRPHIITTDESGGQAGVGGLPAACARRSPPYGFAQIIDISDEKNPRIVSKLMLEVDNPDNCPQLLKQPVEAGDGLLDYSAERCNVDRVSNPTLLACGYRNAGLRVFDIRDPYHPAEIAYYKPPAVRKAVLPGSGRWAAGSDRTADYVAGFTRFRKVAAKETNGPDLQIWFAGSDTGFQVVRFSNDFKVRHKDLFEKALQ
jgi:hypothetical protein